MVAEYGGTLTTGKDRGVVAIRVNSTVNNDGCGINALENNR